MAPERHVLVIDDGNRRAVSLDAAAYSIGRDPSNAIVLNTVTVSRKHAILLRLPIPGENRYRYRLIDGDSTGQPSANGVFVNQQRCSSHELVNGDTISLGRKIQASYLTVAMEEAEFAQYLESIEFHSLKKSNLVDSRATLVADVDPASTGSANHQARTRVQPSSSELAFKSMMIEDSPSLTAHDQSQRFSLPDFIAQHRLPVLATTIVTSIVGMSMGWNILKTQSQEPQQSNVAPLSSPRLQILNNVEPAKVQDGQRERAIALQPGRSPVPD